MDTKHSTTTSSDVSSPDMTDPQPDKSNDDTSGIGRSYECTFCKRGFTNAQALGGHMNIHRKDKAKAKQKNDVSSNKSGENYANTLRFTQAVSSADHQQKSGYYMNYQVYLPSSNPNVQTGNYLPLWSNPHHFEDRVDANLSLRIGLPPSDHEDQEGRDDHDDDLNVKENEVDLELRLGHDP